MLLVASIGQLVFSNRERKRPTEGIIEKYRVSLALYGVAWDWAKENNVDIASLLRGTGLDVSQINDPKCLMTSSQHYRLLNNIINAGSGRAMGLEIGRRADLHTVGLYGVMLLSAPTVETAMRIGALYAPLAGLFGTYEWRNAAGAYAMVYTPPSVSLSLRKYLTEDAFASMSNAVTNLIDEPLAVGEGRRRIRKFTFGYKRPATVDEYEALFDGPLEFEAEFNAMWLDTEFVKSVPTQANAFVFEQCLEMFEELRVELREDPEIIRQTRDIIREDLSNFMNIAEVAKAVGLPLRTFQRRLSQAGTSFAEIQADVRRMIAQDLLCNSKLSIEQISAQLGYSEPSNFRRAFRGWQQMTPLEYRQRMTLDR